MKLFEVRGLCKSYDSRPVLDDIDFDVLRGECLIILGCSGSGKSVTLRQLNGLESPDAGTVCFDGRDVSTLSWADLVELRRRVAMLFQSGALFDSMSVFENVAFPLREHTTMSDSEVEERVLAMLDRVGLAEIGERMPGHLSGGMKKRVALARSLALQPEVVLFDEPTTGLDPVTSASIAALINATRLDLGVTCVVVTHDLELARAVGDRVLFLHQGRLRFDGTWEQSRREIDPSFAAFLEAKPGAAHAA